jgi:hypothetical protein
MTAFQILHGTGRGTARRAVEGAFPEAHHAWSPPSTSLRPVPLPVLGRI